MTEQSRLTASTQDLSPAWSGEQRTHRRGGRGEGRSRWGGGYLASNAAVLFKKPWHVEKGDAGHVRSSPETGSRTSQTRPLPFTETSKVKVGSRNSAQHQSSVGLKRRRRKNRLWLEASTSVRNGHAKTTN